MWTDPKREMWTDPARMWVPRTGLVRRETRQAWQARRRLGVADDEKGEGGRHCVNEMTQILWVLRYGSLYLGKEKVADFRQITNIF